MLKSLLWVGPSGPCVDPCGSLGGPVEPGGGSPVMCDCKEVSQAGFLCVSLVA